MTTYNIYHKKITGIFKDTGKNKIIIHLFFLYNKIFWFCPPNILVTPLGPKCKHGSFCSILYTLSEYCNFEITLWSKQWLLVIQKTTIYW
jgi:hypothetical protein